MVQTAPGIDHFSIAQTTQAEAGHAPALQLKEKLMFGSSTYQFTSPPRTTRTRCAGSPPSTRERRSPGAS